MRHKLVLFALLFAISPKIHVAKKMRIGAVLIPLKKISIRFAALLLLSLVSLPASSTVLLSVSYSNSFINGVFGPFGTQTPVVITATLTNLSASESLTICEGFCLGDSNAYSLGGLASIPNGYSFYFGNVDNYPSIPFDGQASGLLIPGQSKDFTFGVFDPTPGLLPGWYGFLAQIQIFDATQERNFLTSSTFYGNWQVIEVSAIPEPGSLADCRT